VHTTLPYPPRRAHSDGGTWETDSTPPHERWDSLPCGFPASPMHSNGFDESLSYCASQQCSNLHRNK
jgi:hypothetical protein